MRRLPETDSEVHRDFLDGKFVVKRSLGLFRAVGADTYFEQTINRSEKSSTGVISSPGGKQFVAQKEIIYFEI